MDIPEDVWTSQSVPLGPQSAEDHLSAISLRLPGQLGTLGKENRKVWDIDSYCHLTRSWGPWAAENGLQRAAWPRMAQSHLPGHSWPAVCFSSLVSAEAILLGLWVTFAVHSATHQPFSSWQRIRAL